MNKLDLYIARTVVIAVGGALMIILGLTVVFALVDQLGELKKDYGFVDALKYVAWTLPARIYEQLGFSALV
uniref:LptF/LptG family permease n=1 Tax=Janibacter hoylei TaxID=364298 RepID=UPI00248FD6E7